MNTHAPTNLEELVAVVTSTPRLLARGGGTKPALSHSMGYDELSTREFDGIVEYLPDEYTITVQAGTPLAEINAVLAKHRQYLPFDPPLAGAGATIGGTVAAGLSGPGRWRYGGLRDFILGVQLVTGEGRVVYGGGKVVKNAAGFDLPKFLVGSQGRFGVFTEFTFKAFPRATCEATWQVPLAHLAALSNTLRPCDAIELPPDSDHLLVRTCTAGDGAPHPDAKRTEDHPWEALALFDWAHDAPLLVKVPIKPTDLHRVREGLSGSVHLSMAGHLAWVAAEDGKQLSRELSALGLQGLALRSSPGRRHYGVQHAPAYLDRLKHLFDPAERFPALGDQPLEAACSTT